MSWCFTEVVRAFAAGPDGVTSELVESFVDDLERALVRELKRRGLWSHTPELLGLPGYARWEKDALTELADDCYLFHLSRFRSLAAQLTCHPNVDGFVLLNVRHFVFERQRAHDPLGYRLFEVLSAAVERLLVSEEIAVVGEAAALAEAHLRFAGATEGAADPGALERAVRAYSDALAPALFGPGSSRGGKRLTERAAAALRALPQQGIGELAFGTFLDAWKRDARLRRAQLERGEAGDWALEETAGDLLSWVPRIDPDTGIEGRQRFARLVECVARRLAMAGAGDTGEKGDDPSGARAVWEEIVNYAADEASEEPPSQRSLAVATGIPRHRIPELLDRARIALAKCQSALAAHPAVREVEEAKVEGTRVEGTQGGPAA